MQLNSREKKKVMAVDYKHAVEDNKKLAERIEKGPSKLTKEQIKDHRSYAEGDFVRFEKEYKSMGFDKGECVTVSNVGNHIVTLRSEAGREVEWQPWRHSKVEVFKEHELPQKQPSKTVEEKFGLARTESRYQKFIEEAFGSDKEHETGGLDRPASPEKQLDPHDYLEKARARILGKDKSVSASRGLDREAYAVEKDWSEKKPGSLKDLAESLDRMSKNKEPSISAIEEELESIEKLEELDRAIEKVQGRGNEKSPSEGLDLEREQGKGQEEEIEKDKGMQHELTRDFGGGRGFGFGL